MSLLDVIRSAVSIADTVTSSLQPTVLYQQYLGPADSYGTKSYAAAVPLQALVEWKQQQVRTKAGILATSRSHLTLLDVAAVAVVTNGKGINDEDLFTLPDGTSGPILSLAGFTDAGTGQPVLTEVYIG